MGQVPARWARILVGVVTLCALWLLPGEARASEGVGMCADSAQSIDAPPPLYPSRDLTLTECEHFDLRSGIASAPLPDPHSRIWSEQPLHHDLALLPSPGVVVGPASTRHRPPPIVTVVSDEHRASLLRPPCR